MEESTLDSLETKTSPWLRELLIRLLSTGVLQINFTKKDGSQRKMVCTLQESKLPKPENKDGKTTERKSVNESIIHVYDLEKNDWRSIIIDSIKTYSIVE